MDKKELDGFLEKLIEDVKNTLESTYRTNPDIVLIAELEGRLNAYRIIRSGLAGQERRKEVRDMSTNKDAEVILDAIREEVQVSYVQEKYMLRGIKKGLEHLEKKKAPEAATSKGK